jgi:hypothetical protein
MVARLLQREELASEVIYCNKTIFIVLLPRSSLKLPEERRIKHCEKQVLRSYPMCFK